MKNLTNVNILGTVAFLIVLAGCDNNSGYHTDSQSVCYFSEAKINDKAYSDYTDFLHSIGIGKNGMPENEDDLKGFPELSTTDILRTDPSAIMLVTKPKFFVCYQDRKALILYPSVNYSSGNRSTFGVVHIDIPENKIWFEEKLVPPGHKFIGKVKYSSFDNFFVAKLRDHKSDQIIEKKYPVKSYFHPKGDLFTDLTPSPEVMKNIWKKHGSLTAVIYGTTSIRNAVIENIKRENLKGKN